MKYAISITTFAIASLFATIASATCTPTKSTFKDRVGKPGWLNVDEAIRLPYNLSDAPELVIPALEQTGPSKWRPIEGKTYPQGTPGTITGAIKNDRGYIDYFTFTLESGEEIVIDAGNAEDFDFRECDAATLLYDAKDMSVPLGKMPGIPMKPRADAKPLNYSGDWLPSSATANLVYVNCYRYSDGILSSDRLYVNCAPVWKDGVDTASYDLPRELYYENSDLMQITEKPASN
ncbi:hypothetical protein [Rhizobium laguerreae]|uniref:hypothetical protein n=1 Tax=Rhizobium laguerreae TaxID=1076926 RepID=UPI001C918207|nr:hypothetical protein [Rhizobium laguerreae]MBY3314751.1 hypothetical protein [Rhizobium laguerreae]